MPSAFLLDLARCIGCQACAVACSTGNEVPEGASYITISERIEGTFPDLAGGFANQRCMHCTDAACVNVCPTGALFKEDGLTRLNRDACSGCGYCVQSCPYDIPAIVDGRAAKCDGCRDVVKAGGTPWCVQTCPTGALQYGDRDEIGAEAHRRVTALKDRYPDAQVYGEREAGGLGVIMVLPAAPAVIGLPLDPQIPVVAEVWQDAVKPVGLSVTAASVIGAGIAAVIARRNHMAELRRLEEADATAPDTSDDTGEVSP